MFMRMYMMTWNNFQRNHRNQNTKNKSIPRRNEEKSKTMSSYRKTRIWTMIKLQEYIYIKKLNLILSNVSIVF
ncbi:TPA: hypothetical protein DIC40_05320 [Patescibacteria group bacterium]|nr:hypothetical protein [Candidatus Gracilibacteria bacterium]